MNITLLKKSGTKEVINHLTLDGLVAAIKEGEVQTAVKKFREVYHLMKVERQDDGQVTTNWEGGVRMPRICFAADYQNRKGQWQMKGYNGLVVLEVNNLPTYEKAVEIRGLAKKLPETLLCFLEPHPTSPKERGHCQRRSRRYYSFIRTCMRRHAGLIRISSASTSRSWSRDWTERCI